VPHDNCFFIEKDGCGCAAVIEKMIDKIATIQKLVFFVSVVVFSFKIRASIGRYLMVGAFHRKEPCCCLFFWQSRTHSYFS